MEQRHKRQGNDNVLELAMQRLQRTWLVTVDSVDSQYVELFQVLVLIIFTYKDPTRTHTFYSVERANWFVYINAPKLTIGKVCCMG